jgi:hypothetical protein
MKLRNITISIFVIVWLAIFNYESLRHFYLQPLVGKPLPKMKFLFPPAGWIMFYNVDDRAGYAEVYGFRNGTPVPIDPHDIVKTRFIGFDMVKRNVLSTVLIPEVRPAFCHSLQNRFPEFERFVVMAVEYPALNQSRYQRQQFPAYQCP